jgi:hypothetical protein
LPVAFVMPCLNEELIIERSAGSLGFGSAEEMAGDDVFLVLVDNGSTDGTLAAMEGIARKSRPGSVRIVQEPERGFVPPRRRGALLVEQIARTAGATAEAFLILQADADTIYMPGYASWMVRFLGDRTGVLLEGAVKRDAGFDAAYPAYRSLELEIDESLGMPPVSDEDEAIVDDKVCGYRLSDYLDWGGHFREFDRTGGEIHAETTRLLLRARLGHGATKLRVNPAQAIPSRRRIFEDPALHFATSGFPREESWLRGWRDRHPRKWSIDQFAGQSQGSDLVDACFYRRAHDIALFWLLPWFVKRAGGGQAFVPPDPGLSELLSLVPEMTAEEIRQSPGSAIMLVLDAIEKHPAHFRGLWAR